MPPYTAATAELWDRYTSDGDVSAFQGLMKFYAPLAFICACQLKRRRPDFYVDELDDLVSDGLLGLAFAIRRMLSGTAQYLMPGPDFYMRADTSIKATIRNQVKTRTWAGKGRSDRLELIGRLQSELIQEHGRLPTREELRSRLAEHLTNPNIQVGDVDPAAMMPLSAAAYRVADTSAQRPDVPALQSETIRLAFKGLKGEDRKILRIVLNGGTRRDVAAALGISPGSAEQRVNGLLWELRCRPDLAAHLDVEASAKPAPKFLSGKTKYLPRVSQAGPARKIG
jgi:DNA-directed RNA polymerase specialized sigma subunit